MSRSIYVAVLALASLLLFGCPYESKIPISRPTEKVNNNLLGTWESEDEVYNTYIITAAGTHEYHIEQRTSDGQRYQYTGFVSIVRGATFLNAYDAKEKVYYLYRLKIDSTARTVTVMPFAKELPYKFTDTTELNKYVWRSMNLRDFYDIGEQAVYRWVRPAEVGNN